MGWFAGLDLGGGGWVIVEVGAAGVPLGHVSSMIWACLRHDLSMFRACFGIDLRKIWICFEHALIVFRVWFGYDLGMYRVLFGNVSAIIWT